MARIRSIKPEFFRHVELYEAEKASGLPLRIAFAGLWTVADREGRFKWRPRVLALDVLPFDEIDFADVLDALAEHGFIVKYEVDGEAFGLIPSFATHQHVNQREPASSIPPPDGACARTCENIPAHGEGKGREGEGSGLTRPRASLPSAGKGTTIPPDWKPKDPNANPAEVKRFVAYNLSNGTVKADWDAAWEVWESRTADFGEAKASKAQGPPPPPQTYVKRSEPAWARLEARYREERGKPPPTDSNDGWFYPIEWLAH